MDMHAHGLMFELLVAPETYLSLHSQGPIRIHFDPTTRKLLFDQVYYYNEQAYTLEAVLECPYNLVLAKPRYWMWRGQAAEALDLPMASSKALDWLSVAEYAADGAVAAEEAGTFDATGSLGQQARSAAKAALTLAEVSATSAFGYY